MSKENYDNYPSYESELNDFIGDLQQEMFKKFKFNKENLGRRIERFNQKNCADLSAEELLFELIDGEKFTLALQIYPFVMKGLKIEVEKSNKHDREFMMDQIEQLETQFDELEKKYCSVN